MKKSDLSKKPIGVFDSGLGGLTVVRELMRKMPHEDIVYLGDLARLPYGTKSKKQIIEFSEKNARFLAKQRMKALIVACNSASSSALPSLKKHFKIPLIDVIHPAASDAVQKSQKGRIGVIGTLATVKSGSYARAIKRLRPKARIFSEACPLFVPFAEEGWLNGRVTTDVAKQYLRPLLLKKIDTLILGCTHYPILKTTIKKVVGKKVQLIESAPNAIGELKRELEKRSLLKTRGKGRLQIFVTDKGQKFAEIGSRFLGQKITKMKEINPF